MGNFSIKRIKIKAAISSSVMDGCPQDLGFLAMREKLYTKGVGYFLGGASFT